MSRRRRLQSSSNSRMGSDWFGTGPRLFAPAECDTILEICSKILRADLRGSRRHGRHEHALSIPLTHETAYVYEIMYEFANPANHESFSLILWGLEGSLEYTCHSAGYRPRAWHCDHGYDVKAASELIVFCQLSDPASYDGGALEVLHKPNKIFPRTRGAFVALVGSVPYRIAPVTRGSRYSIVSRFCGPGLR
jgi:hypothetical protein